MATLVGGLYLVSLAGLVFFGCHRVVTLWRYGRRRRGAPFAGVVGGPLEDAPFVCIQCPIYNEPEVVVGLLESVGGIDWPAGRLEIQLLDDSTDRTPLIIDRWLREHPEVASRVTLIARKERVGYKAGALAHGLVCSRAGYFAVFDADFRPKRDFLHALMPCFADPAVGMVQARWDFSNRKASLLTRMQAIFLDAHFVVEQTARAESGLFFNFNGTAGVWRRSALVEAGGWSADSVTEDLDISYRAQLAGWRFVYLADYPVASELPEKVTAFKSQQQRWAKGGIQVMRKLLPRILLSRVPLRIKIESFFHLTIGLVHVFLVLFALLFVPYLVVLGTAPQGINWLVHPVVFLMAGSSAVVLYLAGQFFRQGRLADSLLALLGAPVLLSFGLAMSVTCCWAVMEGLFLRGGEFVRTPKGGRRSDLGGVLAATRVRFPLWVMAGAESLMAVLMLGGAAYFALHGRTNLSVVLAIKAAGYLLLVVWFLRESWAGDDVTGRARESLIRV